MKQAAGRINLTGLAVSECSSEASPSGAGDVDVEGTGDAPATPRVVGKLCCLKLDFLRFAYNVLFSLISGGREW